MSDSKNKPPSTGKPGEAGEAKQSGRVAFDARGNPVWEWQTATGKFDRNVSTQRLKKLEAKDLALMDTGSVVPKPKGLAIEEPGRMPCGGVNPYDSVTPAKISGKQKSDPNRQSLATKLAKVQDRQEPQSAWAKLKNRFFR